MTPVIIRAVEWDSARAENALALQAATQGLVAWDHDHRGGWWSFALAVACGQGADGPGVIHLEDDVELSRDWRARVEAEIAEHPEDLVQFFSLRPSDVGRESHHRPGRDFCMTQCFYLPHRLVDPLLDAMDQSAHKGSNYDLVLGQTLRAGHERYWQVLPSVVQHRPWRSVENRRRSSKRQSPTFAA